jgi:CubicO group peptidase (beta-lactamase class C family)
MTFTGLWLATQLADGGLTADEPVQGLLPSTVEVPSYQGTAITLEDLSTHTSGLPDAPTNLAPSLGGPAMGSWSRGAGRG